MECNETGARFLLCKVVRRFIHSIFFYSCLNIRSGSSDRWYRMRSVQCASSRRSAGHDQNEGTSYWHLLYDIEFIYQHSCQHHARLYIHTYIYININSIYIITCTTTMYVYIAALRFICICIYISLL